MHSCGVLGYSPMEGASGDVLWQKEVLVYSKELQFALKTRNYTLFASFVSSKIKLNTVKSVVNSYSKRRQKLNFRDRLLLIAGQKRYKGSFRDTLDLH